MKIDFHYKDVAESVLRPGAEEGLANWLRSEGHQVIEKRGRCWIAKPPGFFHPVHWLARMKAEEALQPRPACWGFRTTLCGEDAHLANGTMPAHVLSSVRGYDLHSLSSKRRNKVRNCMKVVRIVEILAPSLLLEQGYEVFLSARKRTRYGEKMTPEAYRRRVTSYFRLPGCMVLGGLVNGRLGGYVVTISVGSTVYAEEVHIATEALPTNIGTGLIYTLLNICGREEGVSDVIYGLHAREDEALCRYKSEMGFEVIQLPARYWFAPAIGAIIRTTRPHAYYRLTGHH